MPDCWKVFGPIGLVFVAWVWFDYWRKGKL
jgi:hypothetical protein